MEEVITIPVTYYEKLKRDLAIMKRDLRIIEKELIRIGKLFSSGVASDAIGDTHKLIHLIRLLKQR